MPSGGSTLSMSFNGTDAFYQTNIAGLWTGVPLTNFILSCDVYMTSLPGFSFPVSLGRNGGGIALLQEGGHWKIIHQGVAASPPGAAVQLNTWTHLDLVRSNGVSYLYLNGALDITFNSTPAPIADFFTIGANELGSGTPGDVEGNFSGNLANGGERVALEAPELNGTNTIHYTVTETTYGNGGRWGRWSDEGGSSLELIDADADPRFASNWADSDSSTNNAWKTIEFTGTVDNGQGTPDRLQVFLQGAGECLVDYIEVLLAGNAANRLANGTFESGTNGWTFQGTHRLSNVDNTGGFSSSKVLHLRATGRGDTGPNKAQTALTSAFTSGQTATIRAKVRWLAGHPEILFRLRGSWLEAFGDTRTTAAFGTPGGANSRAVTNAGPAITDLTHLPMLPAAFAPVTVYARVADSHGVGGVQLRYRLDTSASVTTVAMDPIGAGVYAGRIPGQGAGTLAAFSVVATDALGVQTSFPNDTPSRECLVRWGESLPGGAIGTYRFWFTRTNRTIWETREPQSNETLDSTFVYGDWRVIYNAGVMYSGSPFHTPLNTGPMGVPCDYQLVMPVDDALLGETDIILSPPGSPWGTDLSILDYTMVREQIIWWIARKMGVPSLHRRFVRVFVNGQARTTIFEDTQQPAGEFIRQWFPNDTGGDLFKAQDWLEFPDTGNNFLSDVRATLEKFVTTGGTLPPKRYRWIWASRAVNGSVHDFTNLFTLVETMAIADTNLFTAQTEALIDIESWFRAMAVQRIAGNWDTWGWTFGKNMYAYKPPGERWAMVPWDIDFSFGLNSSATDSDVMSNANGGGQPGDPIATKLRNQPQLQRAYWRAFDDAVHGAMEDTRGVAGGQRGHQRDSLQSPRARHSVRGAAQHEHQHLRSLRLAARWRGLQFPARQRDHESPVPHHRRESLRVWTQLRRRHGGGGGLQRAAGQ